tara:strand:- start:60970 stop:61278 length:309 start_codon:yes stop_codon:yes gene_type:complete
MLLAIFSIIAGLALLIWSTERYIEGVAATSRYFGMASLLIGVVVVGFELFRKIVELIGHTRSSSEQSFSVRDESVKTHGFHSHVWSQRNRWFATVHQPIPSY